MHDESKLDWVFDNIVEFTDYFEATWKIECWCGAVKYRSRIYTKPNQITKDYFSICSQATINRYLEQGTFHTFFGHTLESATKAAMQSKGDNYHI